MIVDFKQPLIGFNGVALKDGDNPITFGQACISSLLAATPGDENEPARSKHDRFFVAKKIQSGAMDIDEVEADIILATAAKYFGPAVVGPMYEILLSAGYEE